jgi:flagellar protein FliO/FliZ
MRKLVWLGTLLTMPVSAAPVVNVASDTNLVQWLLSCFLVIGLILLLAWLLKKSRLVPSLTQNQLRVLSVLPLGTREKLLVVKVGEQQLLLGMTPANISLLCTLDTPLAEQSLPVPFAAHLGKWMKGGRDVPGTASSEVIDARDGGYKDEA